MLSSSWDRRPFGRAPFGRGAGSPSNTMWPGPRPTSVLSFILIHPTIWPQYTNVTDKTDRQTGQTGQWSDSIGWTVLQTVAQKWHRIYSHYTVYSHFTDRRGTHCGMQGRCKECWRHYDNRRRQNLQDKSRCNSVRHCDRSLAPYTVLACIYCLHQHSLHLSVVTINSRLCSDIIAVLVTFYTRILYVFANILNI